MNDENWFSAKLRFAVMVEPVGGNILNDCVFLLRAIDFKAALDRAIEIGKLSEKNYINHEDKKVLWKFMEVMSLDVIRSKNLDGVEIYSEPVHLRHEEIIPFGTIFTPEASEPIQTI